MGVFDLRDARWIAFALATVAMTGCTGSISRSDPVGATPESPGGSSGSPSFADATAPSSSGAFATAMSGSGATDTGSSGSSCGATTGSPSGSGGLVPIFSGGSESGSSSGGWCTNGSTGADAGVLAANGAGGGDAGCGGPAIRGVPVKMATLPSNSQSTVGLAVDPADEHLYVATDVVTRISLADCSTMALNPIASGSVALDATRVYSVSQTGEVVVCPQTGCVGGHATIAPGQGTAGSSGGSIAVDDTSVYWITSAQGPLMKAALDGGAPTEVAAGAETSGLGATAGSVVYEGIDQDNFGVVMSVPAAGGTPAVRFAPSCDSVSTLIAAGGNAYFATYGNSRPGIVGKVSLETGVETTLAEGEGATATALAVDDANVYWGIQSRSVPGTAIVTVPLQGGALSTLASTLGACTDYDYVSGIAVDGNYVYFAAGASLYKVAK